MEVAILTFLNIVLAGVAVYNVVVLYFLTKKYKVMTNFLTINSTLKKLVDQYKIKLLILYLIFAWFMTQALI